MRFKGHVSLSQLSQQKHSLGHWSRVQHWPDGASRHGCWQHFSCWVGAVRRGNICQFCRISRRPGWQDPSEPVQSSAGMAAAAWALMAVWRAGLSVVCPARHGRDWTGIMALGCYCWQLHAWCSPAGPAMRTSWCFAGGMAASAELQKRSLGWCRSTANTQQPGHRPGEHSLQHSLQHCVRAMLLSIAWQLHHPWQLCTQLPVAQEHQLLRSTGGR